MVNKTLSADILEEALPLILEYGAECHPYEAVGLLAPDGQLVFLTNESEAMSAYTVSGAQMSKAMEAIFEQGVDYLISDLIIWHTHPSGFVGPSRGDIRSRRQPVIEKFAHLVIALPNGETCYY